MPDNTKYRIHDGLPWCIERDPRGFELLKTKLGLNRRSCRQLLESAAAKKEISTVRKALLREDVTSGDRDRSLLFKLYGNSDFRRGLWAATYSEIHSSGSLTGMMPSLEHRVLASHLDGYETSTPGTTRSVDAFVTWPDLVEKLKEDVPWADFAGYVWSTFQSALKSDNWDSLAADERTDTTMVAFALASIVDDERILRYAIDAMPGLGTDFSDLLCDNQTQAPAKQENVVGLWTELCESLRSLSEKAGGSPPDVDVLPEIKNAVNKLSAIENGVRQCCAPILFEHLVSRVNAHLAELEQDQDFMWFGAAERAKLLTHWQDTQDSLTLDQIREELDRLTHDVADAVESIRQIARKLSEASAHRDSLSTESPADLATLHSLEETVEELDTLILASRREQRKARIHLLSQLSPFGTTFTIDSTVRASSPPSRQAADRAQSAPVPFPTPEEPQPTTSAAESAHSATSPDTAHPEPDDTNPTPDDHSHDTPRGSTTENKTTPHPMAPPTASSPSTSDKKEPKSAPHTPSPRQTNGTPLTTRALDRVAAALLEQTPRLAYAVQVSRLIDDQSLPAEAPPVALLEAALLSDRLTTPDGLIASELSRTLERIPAPASFSDSPDPVRDTCIMLALAGTLRPTVIAPQTGAWALLSALKPTDRLGPTYRFANAVAMESQKLQGVRIDPGVLRGASSETAWTDQRDRLVMDVEDWRERAPHMTIKYAPATTVWQRWLGSEGVIAQMLNQITADSAHEARLENLIATVENRKRFNDLVKDTDWKHVGRRKGQDIQARALTQLHDHALQAVSFAHRHLSLRRSRPSQSNFITQALSNLRTSVAQLGPIASADLSTLASTDESILSAAANVAAYAIERFSYLLDHPITEEPDPYGLYASAMFCYPEISVNDDGVPACDHAMALDTLLSTEPQTLTSSFDVRLRNRDFHTARRIIAWLQSDAVDDTTDLQHRLNAALELENRQLRHEIDDTRAKLERARALGHVSPTERDDHDADLVEMERRVLASDTVDYMSERSTIRTIADEIDRALDVQRRMATETLTALDLASDSDEYRTIAHSITKDDIVTANELIDRVRSGGATPVQDHPTQHRDPFPDFYPARAAAIENAMEEAPNPRIVVDHIVRGDSFGGMAFGSIPGSQRQSAKRMLDAWFDLKRSGRLSKLATEKLTILFSELGFIVQRATVRRDERNFGEALVQTVPLADRERCPVPAFGSFVNGNYRIVCLWGRPTEEDILQHAEDSTRKTATLVLYFGRLTKTRRENLGILARRRSQTMITIDEVLLVFLCGERGSRTRVLFSCSIPFTYIQPYVTTAGVVPPEVFYGREQEMRDIADRAGPCFLYGGRQLGKTALLRHVERTSHSPEHGTYAVWIDLKGEGVGHDRAVADIWSSIWRSLRKIMVIPDELAEPNPNVRRRVDQFIDYLCSEFEPSSGRALLLLLDEADKFLEVDAREAEGTSGTGYRESSRLKALMDRTERSIKVVFAGLHNVLRTVAYSNHPLGHFGHPIQIGPLWNAADSLIRQPLLASGYHFQNANLVARILAQTNYYPNLIQLYGTELVKSMCSRRIAGAPLYDIDEEMIDHTYLRNTNLREMLRSRFHMTLQLDPRYEVIAYSIAHECDEYHGVLTKGLSYRRIEELTRSWWPHGFADMEPFTERFRSLLDEMGGLGVLRKVGTGNYTLRNPNVLLLMGTTDEIADNLLRTREPPQEFEPDLFRARDPQMSDGPSRSPLTYRQEDLLRTRSNGVSVICGLKAAGFDNVLRFLKARAASESVVELHGIGSHTQFAAELKRLRSKRTASTTIYVIGENLPWSERWVEEAFDQVDSLRRRGRRDMNVRVLFMADPLHFWKLLSELERFNHNGLQWTALRPWGEGFLRQWMDDVGFSSEKRKLVIDTTGGWPALVERLHAIERETGDLDSAVDQFNLLFDSLPEVGRLMEAFAMDLDGLGLQRSVLTRLAELGEPADFEFLMELAADEQMDDASLRKTLRWGHTLHLVRAVGQDIWELDETVGRLLTATSK
ncbi:MAG: hypothetical protein OXC31_08450 [Spirochaetaceae bacterium]|nr:hypothetical protein [Spirochaetaceae bacterium]